jgi:hypothetical protein
MAKSASKARPAKPAAAPAKAATPKAEAKKPVQPKKADDGKITIKGSGTMPIFGNGEMRRVPKGKPIKVSDAERAYIDHAGIAYA